MANDRRGRWIQAFEEAALDLLTHRTDLKERDAYRCRAGPCPRHGDACLTVICGELMEHVRWEKKTPLAYAEELLSRMLPRQQASE